MPNHKGQHRAWMRVAIPGMLHSSGRYAYIYVSLVKLARVKPKRQLSAKIRYVDLVPLGFLTHFGLFRRLSDANRQLLIKMPT